MKHTRIITLFLVSLVAVFTLLSCENENTRNEEPIVPGNTTLTHEVLEFTLADSCCEAFDACSYNFRVYATGSFDSPGMVGSLIGRTYDFQEEYLLYVEIASDSTPCDESVAEPSQIIAKAIDSVFVVDIEQSTFEKGALSEGGSDLLGGSVYAVMREFFLNNPFADEIAATIVSEGMETIGDVECEVFMVTYVSSRAKWYIGIEDHIPRRVDRIRTDPEGDDFSIVLEILNLDISPDIDNSVFTLEPPDGYEVSNYCAFLQSGSPAPLWSLSDLNGDLVSLEDLRGNVVLLDYWATWCGPCKTVMPAIQSLHEDYLDQPVKVYGINVWEQGDAAAFMEDNGFSYGLLLNGDEVAEDYLVSGIPTLYLIDRNGNIVLSEVGADPEIGEILSAAIDSLLESD